LATIFAILLATAGLSSPAVAASTLECSVTETVSGYKPNDRKSKGVFHSDNPASEVTYTSVALACQQDCKSQQAACMKANSAKIYNELVLRMV
jgi:hypothetical protein